MNTPYIRLAVHEVEENYEADYRLCVLLRLEGGWDAVLEESSFPVDDLGEGDLNEMRGIANHAAALLGLPLEIDATVDKLSLAIENGEEYDPEAEAAAIIKAAYQAEETERLAAVLAKANDFLASVLGKI